MSEDAHTSNPNTQLQQAKPDVKKRVLFVVHRYAPYQGGSENYVRDMAETMLTRGHIVAVFAGEHCGDVRGVHVTSDVNVLYHQWDLIVVHGGDVSVQNYVLERADSLGGPVLYLLVLPSNSPTCVKALHKVRYIGCSTLADWRHVESWGVKEKAVRVRHGINVFDSIGVPGFREEYGITTRYMFLSSGGYWPNKGFEELVNTFNGLKRDDITLVLTGYDNRHQLMPAETQFVKPFLFLNRKNMLAALRSSDLYILNSTSEGFGLVLLEAMTNGTPWAARNIAGAETMREFGFTYDTQAELSKYMQEFEGVPVAHLKTCQTYVVSSYQIQHTVGDILRLIL